MQDHGAALGLGQVVRRDDDAVAASGQFDQPAPDIGAGDDIETGGWLVEQQQRWCVKHRRGELHAPAPAAGKALEPRCEDRGEAPARRRRFDVPFRIEQPMDIGPKPQVLGDGQLGVERKPLRHIADPRAARGARVPDVVADDGAAAKVRPEQSGEHPQRRRLAAAIGTDQTDDRARHQAQRHIAHHRA